MGFYDAKPYYDASDAGRMPDAPTLEDVLRRALRGFAMGLHVCLPAAVVTTRSAYRVDVQPLLQAKYLTASAPTTLPILSHVPVSMPTGTQWAVKFPQPQKGDTGFVVFADRALDAWLASAGGPTDPADGRTHDLTDAIFIPGLQTDAAAQSASTANGGAASDLVVRNGAATLRVEASGRFQVTNGAQELVALAQKTATAAQSLANAIPTTVAVTGSWSPTTNIVANAIMTPDQIAAISGAAAQLGEIAAQLALLAG